MTHRDRAGDPPGRWEAAGGAGHRQGFPTPPAVRPRDRRRLPKDFGRRRPRLAVLFAGVFAMARGGEFNRKWGNKLMRARVGTQGLAILLLLALFLINRGWIG